MLSSFQELNLRRGWRCLCTCTYHESSKIKSVRLTCNQGCSRCASIIDDYGRVNNVNSYNILGCYMYCTLGEQPRTSPHARVGENTLLIGGGRHKTAALVITSLKRHIDCDGWVQYWLSHNYVINYVISSFRQKFKLVLVMCSNPVRSMSKFLRPCKQCLNITAE